MAKEMQALRTQVQVARAALREVNQALNSEVAADAESVLLRLDNLTSQLARYLEDDSHVAARVSETFGEDLGFMRKALTEGDLAEVEMIVRNLESQYGEFIGDMDDRLSQISSPPESVSYLQDFFSSQRRDFEQDREMREAVRLAQSSLARLAESERRAEEAASNAAQAAGETGQTVLGEHFADYAHRELHASNLFRWATIVALAVAAAIALLGAYGSATYTEIARHAVQVVALGGLATFLGAQAANHRRIGNWAKSIEVQLRSFPAFVNAIADETVVNKLYELLGARVLGAHPGALRGKGGEELKYLAQVVELVGKRSGTAS